MRHEGARYDDIVDYYIGDVRGARCLDVACGSGHIARELAARGGDVVGVDISDALLERASAAERQEPLGIAYVNADATSERTLAGGRFDVAVCNHGIADIDDLDGALATVARVLRPGGRFVLTLLHPCFPGWDAEAPSSWPRAGGYWEEGYWLAANPGIRGKVGSNHRTLSTYLNALVRHGLAIAGAAEPAPGPALQARQLIAQPGAGPVPMFLLLSCRRVEA